MTIGITGLIGVEFEFPLDPDELSEITGHENVGYNHNVYDTPVIKSDSSCGSELVTHPFNLKKVDEFRFAVDEALATCLNEDLSFHRCGLHVHVGVDPQLVGAPLRNKLMRLWVAYDDQWDEILRVFPWRNPETNSSVSRFCGRYLGIGDKYGSINVSHLLGGGMYTVEFRQAGMGHNEVPVLWETMVGWMSFVKDMAEHFLEGRKGRCPQVLDYVKPWETPTEVVETDRLAEVANGST